MGIASLLLTAAGAVLRWGVSASWSGLNVNTIGLILIVVGIVGCNVAVLLVELRGVRRSRRGSGGNNTVVLDRDTVEQRV